jgi:hypothetical protein
MGKTTAACPIPPYRLRGPSDGLRSGADFDAQARREASRATWTAALFLLGLAAGAFGIWLLIR